MEKELNRMENENKGMEYLNNEIDGKLEYKGNEVKLVNPGFDGMAPFLRLAREMSKGGIDMDESDFMGKLSNTAIDDLMLLIKLTLKKTFKEDYDTDREDLEQWAMQNMMILMPKVFQSCVPKQSMEQTKKMAMIKKLQDDRKSINE